jgi:hypothetical protein
VGTTVDARIALLERLIDHAPLFPPASLPLHDALEEDRRARESPSSFVLARFVCPASRLAELPDSGRALSAVLDAEVDLRPGVVEAVEARYRDDLDALGGLAPEVYVEVAPDDDLASRLDEIAARGFGAKIRCGGEAAPDVSAVAAFVDGCRERAMPFKATAGLHHAVRAGSEHGFLNLLAAVVFEDPEGALSEEEPDAFRVAREGFGWRGRVAGPDEVARARRDLLRSIGSCSFFEPVEELVRRGDLPL